MAEARALIAEQIEYRELLLQMTRRDLLRVGGSSMLGLSLGSMLQLQAQVPCTIRILRCVPAPPRLWRPLHACRRLLSRTA